MRWKSRFGATVRLAAAALAAAACGRTPAPPADGARTGWITVPNRIRIFYEIQGQGDTLILIHGGFVDRRMWDQQADELARSYTVIRYDLRGFGRSDLPTKPYHAVNDLLALYDALGIGSASLIGLSMGGGVALSFTLAYPERVNALVLAASPANGLPVQQEDIDRIMALFEAGNTGGADSAVALWLRHPMLAALMEKPELASRMEFLARENARFFTLPFWPFESEEPPASERLGEIRVPTLVIWGDRDTETVQQNSAATAERIPGARTGVLRGAGHMVNMERPHEFLRAVRALLEEVPDA